MSVKIRRPGELEALVMDVIWQLQSPASGQEIQGELAKRPGETDFALTTVLTVLQRLADKGLVRKQASGEGRGVRFEAVTTRERHSAQALLSILQAEDNSDLTLSHFVGSLSADQRSALEKALKAEG